jgi:hypothetical protein
MCYRRAGPAPERRAVAGSDVAAERVRNANRDRPAPERRAGSDVAAERHRNAARGGGA